MKTRLETAERATILVAEGRLDFNSAPGFEKDMDQALARAGASSAGLIVDCAALEYVSSAGLRVFLLGARNASRAKLAFAVCSLSETVREVFELSGFNRVMTVVPDRAAALALLPPVHPA
jgi:anti-sigma B factor antagonist